MTTKKKSKLSRPGVRKKTIRAELAADRFRRCTPRTKKLYQEFDPKINYRERKDLYQIGIGEQGVLIVQPYKDEILPHWRFKTPAEAKISSTAIYKLFLQYLRDEDFPGADMARKYLQMGYTRSRRYANHSSGVKYKLDGKVAPIAPSAEKAQSAEIFYAAWMKAARNKKYIAAAAAHQAAQSREGPA